MLGAGHARARRPSARWARAASRSATSRRASSTRRVGGCVATRSAGQASTGYGRIDELVAGVRCAAPAGELDAAGAAPASAAGPDLRELVVGLGGRARGRSPRRPCACARARRRGATRAGRSASFAAGARRSATWSRSTPSPDVARLSDEAETRCRSRWPAEGDAGASAGYLRAARLRRRLPGDHGLGGRRRRRRAPAARRRRACSAPRRRLRSGARPGRGLGPGRYRRPTCATTCSTTACWSRRSRRRRRGRGCTALHDAVGDGAARRARAARHAPARALPRLPPLPVGRLAVLHLHGPPGAGARARRSGGRRRRRRATRSWPRGGTITHHHAIGRDHCGLAGGRVGATGIDLLRAVKAELDPAGIMNPGKLLP